MISENLDKRSTTKSDQNVSSTNLEKPTIYAEYDTPRSEKPRASLLDSMRESDEQTGLSDTNLFKGMPIIEQLVIGGLHSTKWISSNASSLAAMVFEPVYTSLAYVANYLLDTLKLYMNEYPVLRSFVSTFLLMTCVPIAVFLTYAIATTAICISIAASAVTVVESFIMGFGLLILAPVLFFSFFASVFAVGAYYAVYYSLTALSTGIESAQQAGVAPRGPISDMTKYGLGEAARGIQETKEFVMAE